MSYACPFDTNQIVGSIVLSVMGVLFHVLSDMPLNIETKRRWLRAFFSQLRHPVFSEKEFNQTAFYTFVCLAVGALIGGLTFAVTGNYKFAAIGYAATWLSWTVAAWIRCVVFSRAAGIAWTVIVAVFVGCLCLFVYFITCPTLTVSPSMATFSHSGELFTFRVDNKSEDDTYRNVFLFHLDSEVYGTGDFDFQISQESLKPLRQQLDGADFGVPDISGIFGVMPQSSTRYLFVLYVYHLMPHESREITIRLSQHKISTVQKVEIYSEIMSYTHKAMPVSKDEHVVYVPALITQPLTVTGFLLCEIKQGLRDPCVSRPVVQKSITLPVGCVSVAAVNGIAGLPKQIMPGKCDP